MLQESRKQNQNSLAISKIPYQDSVYSNGNITHNSKSFIKKNLY